LQQIRTSEALLSLLTLLQQPTAKSSMDNLTTATY
jgi:hypothetical protein